VSSLGARRGHWLERSSALLIASESLCFLFNSIEVLLCLCDDTPVMTLEAENAGMCPVFSCR
jgi:hypothetical protein